MTTENNGTENNTNQTPVTTTENTPVTSTDTPAAAEPVATDTSDSASTPASPATDSQVFDGTVAGSTNSETSSNVIEVSFTGATDAKVSVPKGTKLADAAKQANVTLTGQNIRANNKTVTASTVLNDNISIAVSKKTSMG